MATQVKASPNHPPNRQKQKSLC
ncbi:hypothetical protein DFAR_3270005 [Desulfarculales bacterium]